jgi:hypothetical protein
MMVTCVQTKQMGFVHGEICRDIPWREIPSYGQLHTASTWQCFIHGLQYSHWSQTPPGKPCCSKRIKLSMDTCKQAVLQNAAHTEQVYLLKPAILQQAIQIEHGLLRASKPCCSQLLTLGIKASKPAILQQAIQIEHGLLQATHSRR